MLLGIREPWQGQPSLTSALAGGFMKQAGTSQVAKWAAVAALLLAALYATLWFAVEGYGAGNDGPSVVLFVFMGAGVLALVASFIAVVAVIANRLERRRTKHPQAAPR